MSDELRYCLVCDKNVVGGLCEACGSSTFTPDDPEVALIKADEVERSADRFEDKAVLICAFVVGVPVFAIASPFIGWLYALPFAAFATGGAMKGLTTWRARKRK